MKPIVVKLKATATLIALVVWSASSFAQAETIMYVMKNGEVVFQLPVSGVDNVTFDEAAFDSTLIVRKNDGSPFDKILLNDIQQLSFSDETLFIETLNGSEAYDFENIANLFFGDINTIGINNSLTQNNVEVLVSLTSTGDVIVESSVAIKSLSLFSTDGKMISRQQCNGVETQCIVSLHTAGVYLLCVETEQGTVVKKVANPK